MKTKILLGAVFLFGFPGLALAQPAPEDIVTQGDANHDGGIDKTEWAAMGAPVDFPEQADTNKDGKIDLTELRALFAQFQNGGPPPAQSSAAAPAAPAAQAPRP